jgi:hypothetical protein
MTTESSDRLLREEDFYFENGLLVFTRQYHLKRGVCCGSGCRHCPYSPRAVKGTTTPAEPEPAPDERKPF